MYFGLPPPACRERTLGLATTNSFSSFRFGQLLLFSRRRQTDGQTECMQRQLKRDRNKVAVRTYIAYVSQSGPQKAEEEEDSANTFCRVECERSRTKSSTWPWMNRPGSRVFLLFSFPRNFCGLCLFASVGYSVWNWIREKDCHLFIGKVGKTLLARV